MHVNLFFDLYFNFLSVKTEINKKNNKRLNWINLEGSDALKRQKYDTWIAMWLNHFEIDVIWTAFKGFLKLHSHISVFWGFSTKCGQAWTSLDRGTERGVPKIPKFVRTSFMDDPLQAPKFHTLAITIYCYRNLGLAVTIAKIVQNVLETTKN